MPETRVKKDGGRLFQPFSLVASRTRGRGKIYANVRTTGSSRLLQSEEYAIAMIRAARSGDTDLEIEQRVHVRMARQSLLTQDDPIDLRVVLDEAVLSRPVGGDGVMRDQLM